MTEREIFEKYKLSEYELNTKSKKNVYVENVINTIIECCRGEKKKPKEKYMGSEKSWWFQSLKIRNVEVKSKKGNIFVNKKILEEYSVKIYKIDSCFCDNYKEKIQVSENGCEYTLLRTDVYFTEYLWAVEIDKKTRW